MKHKSNTLEAFQKFCAEFGIPEILHTDNGKEFTSKQFKKWCLEHGIHQEFTIPYTPEQNGRIERMWQTLLGMIRALLKEAGFGPEWWNWAMKMAIHIMNRLPSNSNPDGKSSHELYYGVDLTSPSVIITSIGHNETLLFLPEVLLFAKKIWNRHFPPRKPLQRNSRFILMMTPIQNQKNNQCYNLQHLQLNPHHLAEWPLNPLKVPQPEVHQEI